ncbi:cysteine synthase A [Hyphococcus sp. DH-69]|uniref:cysteine synthase A n=1 Tax=Hyphococcus formosus TaxID=3143534 RepID=UPI00398B1E0C
MKHESILGTVGNTPVIRINRLAPDGVNMFVKFEAFNPLGSVKDRLALGVIEAAEKSGELKPGQTVVEATSGNTGIGLAMVCAAKGYPLVVTMAESFSVERRKLMRFLGAKVVLTPAAAKGTGMVEKAKELAKKNGWFLTRQFENDANPAIHERTTGPEIIEAFKGEKLDYWVTGFGTGGTLTGVSRVLKKHSPDTKIVVCEPSGAAMLSSGQGQERNDDGSPAASHPAWTPHPIQGWSPDFIPAITDEAVKSGVIHKVLKTAPEDGMKWSQALAQKEGIFTGISAGATFAAAIEVANEAPKGSTILCMLPDTGERYLSTPLFAGIEADMSVEEMEISRSTDGYQLSA